AAFFLACRDHHRSRNPGLLQIENRGHIPGGIFYHTDEMISLLLTSLVRCVKVIRTMQQTERMRALLVFTIFRIFIMTPLGGFIINKSDPDFFDFFPVDFSLEVGYIDAQYGSLI